MWTKSQNLVKLHHCTADGERLQIRSDVEDGEIPTKNAAKNKDLIMIDSGLNGHGIPVRSDSDSDSVRSVQNDKRCVLHVQPFLKETKECRM